VEELLDVQIDHPVRLPAPPPAGGHRVQRGTLRAVPVGIRVEEPFGPFLQHSGHHRLRDPVGDGRHTENPGARSVRLRDLHRAHRRREVRPRRHPIPDLVEVALQILLEAGDGLPVHSGRTLIRPDFLPRLPDSPLRNLKRLARRLQPVHATPPRELLVDRTNTATNDPAPSLRPHYRGLSATTSRDRKSTRLNSSHVSISYAVFCLK